MYSQGGQLVDLHGRKINKPDRTEGYATLTLQRRKDLSCIKTIGYFVKDDAVMQSYLQDSPAYYAQKSAKVDLNFVYFYLSEPDLNKTLLSTGIEVYRFNEKNNPKNCIIINKNDPNINPVCKKKPHIFLPASHNKLITSKFLKKYSKSVTSTENLSEGNYKGVEFIQEKINKRFQEIPRSVKFSVSISNSKNDLCIEAGVFEKLRDNGPLLYEEEKDNWALVGWYEKDSQQKRIKVHHLRAQDPLYIKENNDQQSCQSANEQPDGLSGNGNDHEQHSDCSGQSQGSSADRTDHSTSNSSQCESSSGNTSNNYEDPFYIWKDLQSCRITNEHPGVQDQPRNTTDVSMESEPVQGNHGQANASARSKNEPNRPRPADLPPTSSNNEPNRPGPADLPSTGSNNEPNRPRPADLPSISSNNEPTRPGPADLPSTSSYNEPNRPGPADLPPTSSNNEPNRPRPADLPPTSSNNEPNRPGTADLPSTSSNNEPTRTGPADLPSTSSYNEPNRPGQAATPPEHNESQDQTDSDHQNRDFDLKCELIVVYVRGVQTIWKEGDAIVLQRYNDNPSALLEPINQILMSLMNYRPEAFARAVMPGCFKLLIETSSLESLELIWKSYNKGDLKNKLKDVIVTDELRTKAPDDAIDVDISITISEEDYRKTRDYHLEVSLRKSTEGL